MRISDWSSDVCSSDLHIVSLKPAGQRVTVRLGGEVIAETDRAVLCEETGHDPVYYIPMTDTRAALLRPSSTRSHCPLKGDASYWSVSAGGKDARNAAWSYDLPYDEAAGLRGQDRKSKRLNSSHHCASRMPTPA